MVIGLLPTRETCSAAASDPRYALCQISAPTRSAIDALMKKLSPAPATSLGEGLNAGRRSVTKVPPSTVLISMPSAPSVITRFSARALWISRSPIASSPVSKSFRARRASRSVGVISDMPLKRETSPSCDEAWLSAASITSQAARFVGDGIDEVLRQAAIIEAGEQQQIAIRQRPLDRAQHPALDIGAWRMVAQMVDAEQRLVQGTVALLSRGGPGGIRKIFAAHALLFEHLQREAGELVLADHGAIADLGAEPARMRRYTAGAADKGLGHDRGHDNGRILLRHPDGVARDIFVDDEIADDQHPHARHSGERRFELRELETVADRKIERLDDRGEIRIRIIPLHQRQRGKAQLARTEHQPPAIAVDHRLLGVVAVLELLALDHHVRLQ